MEKQWIDDLRKRFADREVPVPEGLWDDIQSAMAGKDLPFEAKDDKKRTRLIPVWGRWAAAAVACAAVVAGVVKYGAAGPSELTADRHVVRSMSLASAVKADAGTYADEGNAGTSSAGNAFRSELAYAAASDAEAAVPEHEAGAVAEYTSVPVDDAGENDSVADVMKKSVSVVNRPPDSRRTHYYNRTDGTMLASASNTRGGRDVSVGFYGTNLMAIGGASAAGGASFMPAGMYDGPVVNEDFAMMTVIGAHLSKAESADNEINVKHRQPVRVGMSVRYSLTDRLGIETGLNYSYLSSDIASGDDDGGFRTEQKLHYVGIPLGLNYNVWKTDFFEVYASAGATAEFCVSGHSATDYVSEQTIVRRTETELKDSRPQWSVNAAAGVQYNFNDVIGVYAEPGVSYYFNNGSSVTTIYKDKPFNFNLNLGLRFSIR